MTNLDQARAVEQRLREKQADMWDAIKSMDMGESDMGIMSVIRAEQHDLFKKSADNITALIAEVERLREALESLLKAYSYYFKEGNPWGDAARAALKGGKT